MMQFSPKESKQIIMLKRKIDEKLSFWHKNRKQALLITGVRQIGKSYSINKYIHDNFDNVIAIDFSNRVDLIDSFVFFNNNFKYQR